MCFSSQRSGGGRPPEQFVPVTTRFHLKVTLVTSGNTARGLPTPLPTTAGVGLQGNTTLRVPTRREETVSLENATTGLPWRCSG